MRALVVYESVFGNTHRIAEAVAEGLPGQHGAEVAVLTPEEADQARLADADLVVVGGPTHVHGMARPSSKSQGAKQEEAAASKGEPAHQLDENAYGETLRHWFHDAKAAPGARAAAFDTRIDAAAALTGRASKGISRRLHQHGWSLAVEPESFLVDKHNDLVDGELERARQWGRAVASAVQSVSG